MSQTGPRAAASARRRRALLDAALELFPKKGVGNCRLEDLLERSGASVGSFYHHFGGKPELAAALYLRFLDDSMRLATSSRIESRGSDWRRRLIPFSSTISQLVALHSGYQARTSLWSQYAGKMIAVDVDEIAVESPNYEHRFGTSELHEGVEQEKVDNKRGGDGKC